MRHPVIGLALLIVAPAGHSAEPPPLERAPQSLALVDIRPAPPAVIETWDSDASTWPAPWQVLANSGSVQDTHAGQGRQTTTADGDYGGWVIGYREDLPANLDLRVDVIPDGIESYYMIGIRAPGVEDRDCYELELSARHDSLHLRRQGPNRERVYLGTFWLINEPGDVVHLRWRAQGPRMQVKAWVGAGGEPVEWAIDVSDDGYSGPGIVYLKTINGTAPVGAVGLWDNLVVLPL